MNAAEPVLLPADPRAGYLAHREKVEAAISRVLASGHYILGPEVAAFEQEFAAYLGVAQAVGVGNGTDAIVLALRTLDIGPGDTVITTANTAVATVAAIELAGALPLLVEVDPGTLTLSPAAVEQALTGDAGRRVKALIPVHLFGQPADMPALMALAAAFDLRVIEDCAQAHGAAIAGRKVGTWGDLATFSFYPTKNLGALGDGGAVVSQDAALAERMRSLRIYGWRERYISHEAGMNTRLDELQAAILRVKLGSLDAENDARRERASFYDQALVRVREILRPAPAPAVHHVYHQYSIRLPRRDEAQTRLRAAGIETAILYPEPIHLQPAYRGRIASAGTLSVTEKAARELLCLPVHPAIDQAGLDRTVAVLLEMFHG